MKCAKCGAESNNAKYCVNCGNELLSPLDSLYRRIFSSGKFLAMCIILTCSIVFAFMTNIASNTINFDIIGLIMTIALWITYGAARSTSETRFKAKGIKIASGTMLAYYIICWILVGIMGILTIIVSIAALGSGYVDWTYYLNYYGSQYLMEILGSIPPAFIFITIAIGLFIGLCLVIVLNLIYIRPLHLFIKSMYQSFEADEFRPRRPVYVRRWLLVMGILSGLSGLISLFVAPLGAVSGLCSSALQIIGYAWIKGLDYENTNAPLELSGMPEVEADACPDCESGKVLTSGSETVAGEDADDHSSEDADDHSTGYDDRGMNI